jgi:hypothetical protein
MEKSSALGGGNNDAVFGVEVGTILIRVQENSGVGVSGRTGFATIGASVGVGATVSVPHALIRNMNGRIKRRAKNIRFIMAAQPLFEVVRISTSMRCG